MKVNKSKWREYFRCMSEKLSSAKRADCFKDGFFDPLDVTDFLYGHAFLSQQVEKKIGPCSVKELAALADQCGKLILPDDLKIGRSLYYSLCHSTRPANGDAFIRFLDSFVDSAGLQNDVSCHLNQDIVRRHYLAQGVVLGSSRGRAISVLLKLMKFKDQCIEQGDGEGVLWCCALQSLLLKTGVLAEEKNKGIEEV